MSAQNNLSISLQQLDATGVTITRRVENFSFSSPTFGEWRVGNLPDTNQATISLVGLAAQVYQLLLKNAHASAKITVVWTPTGGASATALILGPGDEIGFWHQATGATYGISQLKLTSDTANTPFELFLGG